jgi:hypothetical protein
MYKFNMIKACINLGYAMVGFCLMIGLIVNSEILFSCCFQVSLFKKKYILSEFSTSPSNFFILSVIVHDFDAHLYPLVHI